MTKKEQAIRQFETVIKVDLNRWLEESDLSVEELAKAAFGKRGDFYMPKNRAMAEKKFSDLVAMSEKRRLRARARARSHQGCKQANRSRRHLLR
jgi:hypothetical protein